MSYEMRECVVDGLPPPYYLAAYTPDGHFIGTEEWAKTLEERGIKPEKRTPESSVCSIGFCEAEQKWYGWSHRAMYGFGIGSKVSKGDCAYTADTVDGLIEDYIAFSNRVGDPEETRAELIPDYENKRVWVGETHYQAKTASSVDGVALCITHPDMMPDGQITLGGYWMGVGRGEWTAQTLEDAKQMACDFAEGVS